VLELVWRRGNCGHAIRGNITKIPKPKYPRTMTRRDLDAPYVRDEMRRLRDQRYADKMEERPNILTTNLMRNVETRR